MMERHLESDFEAQMGQTPDKDDCEVYVESGLHFWTLARHQGLTDYNLQFDIIVTGTSLIEHVAYKSFSNEQGWRSLLWIGQGCISCGILVSGI